MTRVSNKEGAVNSTWTEKKSETASVAAALFFLADSLRSAWDREYWQRRALRIENCSCRLVQRTCKECGFVSVLASRCRDRMCPVCQWRLSLDRFYNLLLCNEWFFEQNHYLNAAMLTLTVPNCTGEELPGTVERMLAAWRLLTKRRPFQRWIIGYARSVEIVRKKGRKFHPHIHVFVWFPAEYNKEITTLDLASWWSECYGHETGGDPSRNLICDMKFAYDKKKRGKRNIRAADITGIVAEATKYSMKAELISTAEPAEIVAIDRAIRGKRLVEYGGLIKKARAALRLDDEAADIETPAGKVPACLSCGSLEVVDLTMLWAVNSYRLADPLS